jgi:hypothetical protein
MTGPCAENAYAVEPVGAHQHLDHPLPGELLHRHLVDGERTPQLVAPTFVADHRVDGHAFLDLVGASRNVLDQGPHLGRLQLGEEADVAKVHPEDRHVAGQAPLRSPKDVAVAAEDHHQLAVLAVLHLEIGSRNAGFQCGKILLGGKAGDAARVDSGDELRRGLERCRAQGVDGDGHLSTLGVHGRNTNRP